VDVEGCGRLIVHDGLLDVAWVCVCKLGGSLVGGECKLGGGGWCKCECECVGKLSDSCHLNMFL
jgi:hypothetical protein